MLDLDGYMVGLHGGMADLNLTGDIRKTYGTYIF
jgi:hypothetical protein